VLIVSDISAQVKMKIIINKPDIVAYALAGTAQDQLLRRL
jgi:hypothetical protein